MQLMERGLEMWKRVSVQSRKKWIVSWKKQTTQQAMEEHYAARELAAAIERFLDTQSKENRVLFMRRYWYADSFAEIGKLLGITEGNARLRLTRMRKQLKTYLTEQEVLV